MTPVHAMIETIVKLAVSDGEYIGRHTRYMDPADVINLRDGATAERIKAVRATLKRIELLKPLLTPAELAHVKDAFTRYAPTSDLFTEISAAILKKLEAVTATMECPVRCTCDVAIDSCAIHGRGSDKGQPGD